MTVKPNWKNLDRLKHLYPDEGKQKAFEEALMKLDPIVVYKMSINKRNIVVDMPQGRVILMPSEIIVSE